jgi:hypothetical protein
MEMLVIAVIALVAFGAVLVPLFRRKSGVNDDREFDIGADAESASAPPTVAPMAAGPATPVAPPPVNPPDAGEHAHDDIEAEVLRYRAALRAGTVCRKCGQANEEGSVFCADCGTRLPREDAREFE